MPGLNVTNYGEEVRTVVDHSSTTPNDCLAWAAIIFATNVLDEPRRPPGIEDTPTLSQVRMACAAEPHAMGATLHRISSSKSALPYVRR
jgi:hypothetical protein